MSIPPTSARRFEQPAGCAAPSPDRCGTSADKENRTSAAEAGQRTTAVHLQMQAMLVELFAALERHSIPYCVLHGYEGLPHRVSSDVDMLVAADTPDRRIAEVLKRLQHARLVRHSRGSVETFVLASTAEAQPPVLLQLDVSRNVELSGRLPLYPAGEVLQHRRQHGRFFVPSAKHEFCATLLRRMMKPHWQTRHGEELTRLYRQDRQGCDEQLRRFWSRSAAGQISDAAAEGRWQAVVAQRRTLLRQAVLRTVPRRPLAAGRLLVAGLLRRTVRWTRPSNGFHVTFLGPDGCGKSSAIAGVQRELRTLFPQSQRFSFPPRLLQRTVGTPTDPHALQPRSPLASAVRATLYWGAYYSLGYCWTVYPALISGQLVVHDRHLIDALVDPRRYRYAGPAWLLRLLWRLVPRADVVILLDAPAETIQQRKQEVAAAETARQCDAYRQLVAALPNGHTVDASQPLDEVVRQICQLILERRADRLE